MLDLEKVLPLLPEALNWLDREQESFRVELEMLDAAFTGVLAEPQKLDDLIDSNWSSPDHLLARPEEPLGKVCDVSVRPPDVELVAVDGSQNKSPFASLPCYLLNMGVVRLRLGNDATAEISHLPELRYIAEFDGRAHADEIIMRERSLQEFNELSLRAASLAQDRFSLALTDGGLTFWFLMQGGEARMAESALRSMTTSLSSFRKSGIPLAGYISGSRAHELMNSLRLFSTGVVGESLLPDRVFWERRLKPGQRGPLFRSNSHVVSQYYESEDVPFFFPLHVGSEVARVEIPGWCIPVVDTIASVIFDQAVKGGGYPLILDLAHQEAVIKAGDADVVWQMLTRQAEKRGVHLSERPKNQSKRRNNI